MALNGSNWRSLEDVAFEGTVRCVAAPSWVRPCFAIPMVSLGPQSNALYVQEVDPRDRIINLSPLDVPDQTLLTLADPIPGLTPGASAIHAVIGPEGEILAGTRDDLAPRVSTWLSRIDWAVTRLAFADFVGDEREIIAAADAALKDKSARQGPQGAAIWFATSVVFRRLQRSAMDAATSLEHRAELEVALDQIRMDVTLADVVVHLPPVLVDLFEGANMKAAPAMTMARKLAMLASPGGLTLRPIQLKPKSADSRPSKGGSFTHLWQELYADLLADPADPTWSQRWRFAWETSRGHADFENLAQLWLARHQTSDLESGQVLQILLGNRYRRPLNPSTIQQGILWLSRCSSRTPRWPKIWSRIAKVERLPRQVINAAFRHFQDTERGALAQRDWIRVWAILRATEPELRQHLDLEGLRMFRSCKNHVEYIRRVAIPLFNDGVYDRGYSELWDSIDYEKNQNEAWAEFYLHMLEAAPDDQNLHRIGMDYLNKFRVGSRRWARVWVALVNVIGPDDQLIILGARYLQQIPEEKLRQSPVYRSLDLLGRNDLIERIEQPQLL